MKLFLNDYLLKFGGHIGYAVRQSKRNRGYATEILSLGLKKAKELGFNKVLITVDEENIASEKVIIKNNGKLENIVFDAEENVNVKRYWIGINK